MKNPVKPLHVGYTRLSLRCVAHILLPAVLWAMHFGVSEIRAGDVWKDKKYENWTADDVRSIQSDSPWAKKLIKDAPWIKGNGGYLSAMPMGCDGRPDFSRNDPPPPQIATGLYTRVEFRVNWVSSRTMRNAKIQESVLCGSIDRETAEGMLEEEVDFFQIEVRSPDMMPFESMDDDAIRVNTWLIFKKTQKKINPDEIAIQRNPGQKRIFSISFMFNKKDANGESQISPDEKEIEFATQAGKFALKARFLPPKMITGEGPDL